VSSEHVAAGFMPAFKFQNELSLVMETGHKARGYTLRLRARDFGAVGQQPLKPATMCLA
jgi:hypothetical protein